MVSLKVAQFHAKKEKIKIILKWERGFESNFLSWGELNNAIDKVLGFFICSHLFDYMPIFIILQKKKKNPNHYYIYMSYLPQKKKILYIASGCLIVILSKLNYN